MIQIQPKQTGNKLPYPYFIEDNGKVGRQDFWKGKPEILIGFTSTKTNANTKGDIDVSVFLKEPQKAVGMYPIMKHADGEWYTYQTPIESIREIK